MTAEKLHDALNLLSGDLIAETDALRTQARKPQVHWQRWAAMAACLAVVLLAGSRFSRFLGMDKTAETAGKLQMAAAEAPDRQENAAADFEAADEVSPGDSGHAHVPAGEPDSAENALSGYCGNTSVTVSLNGNAYTVSGSDAVTLTSILESLDYTPENLCTCPVQFTVTTESGMEYEVDPAAYFARCDAGQAALTQQQADAIQKVVDKLEDALS